MKYAVDEIIDNIVVLENIENGTTRKVPKDLLPKNITDGTIVFEDNGIFCIDNTLEKERKKCIQEKLNHLKSLNNNKKN